MKELDHSEILFSCYRQTRYETEQVVREHSFVSVVSGLMEITLPDRKLVLERGDMALISRNQLARVKKLPDASGFEFKSISLLLSQSVLRTYAIKNSMRSYGRYAGDKVVHFYHNRFLKAYFGSLEPYLDQPEKMTNNLAELKSFEAIELLIDQDLAPMLFDFSEPFKIDLERFMLENFKFNLSLGEMARLTGRSLSTFKRDFKTLFDMPPQKWLTARRLEEANFLITQKHKRPSDIYYELGFENFSHFSKIYNQAYK